MLVGNADGDIRYVPEEMPPGAQDTLMVIAHEGRYAWFSERFPIQGRSVLDFGCGSGYGAGLMAAKGARVTGVDISPASIAHATRAYPAAAFMDMDLTAADVPERIQGQFDFVVSFDVIEHVEKYWQFVRNIRQLLSKDGIAVIGCPNRFATFDYNVEWNPYHVQEFTPTQLAWILRTEFSSVTMLGQDFVSDDARAARLAVQPNALWHFKHGLAKSPIGPALVRLKNSLDRLRKPPHAGPSAGGLDLVQFAELDLSDEASHKRPFGLVAVCTGRA
jgi:2-polyprenyl-3-methyl-5-hydroxy-6-metoxy-1,4-benzoquinol methylase